MYSFRLLLLSACLFFSFTLQADHFIGGHFSFNCIQTNLTFVTLSLMVENDVSAFPDNPAQVQIYYKANAIDTYEPLMLWSMEEDDEVQTQIFLEARNFTQSIYGRSFFFSEGVGYYKFVYQRCCRTNDMANLEMSGEQGTSIEMEIFYDGTSQNCTPVGENKPVANSYLETCISSGQLNFEVPTNTAFGDSLSFSFCALRAAGSSNSFPNPQTPCDFPIPDGYCPDTALIYTDGFSALEPFGLGANISLDPITGIVSGDMPDVGRYHFGICVDEFREGVRIKSIAYDLQLRVKDCDKICEEDILLSTQMDLDSFVNLNCFPIKGSLTIVGANIQDLLPLAQLDSIYGNLTIEGTSFSTLEGLNNLVYIGGSLTLDNTSLTSIEALAKLTKAEKGLYLLQNQSISTLQPLSQFTRLEGDLHILGNRNLTSLAGLENIDSIFGDFRVEGNFPLSESPDWTQLKYVGDRFSFAGNQFSEIDFLEALNKVDGTFTIAEGEIINLNGFSQLSRVEGYIQISVSNSPATQINGFNKLNSVGGSFFIQAGSITELKGFQNLTEVSANFQIRQPLKLVEIETFEQLQYVGGMTFFDCQALESLPPFSKLDTIRGNLTIDDCHQIKSINGFNQLKKIGLNVMISDMDELTTFKGFELLDTISGSLVLTDLQQLSALPAFESLKSVGQLLDLRKLEALTDFNGFNQLNSVGGTVEISSNSSLMNISGFNELSYVGEFLRVGQHGSLTNISGFEKLLFIGRNLIMDGNNELSDCTAFCDFLRNGQLLGDLRVTDNGPNCSEFIKGCAQAIAKGIIYYDLNQNGIQDSGERNFPYGAQQVQIQPDAINVVNRPDGTYNFNIDEGTYTLGTKEESPFKVTNVPLSLNVSSTDTDIDLDIGLYAETEITAGESSVALPDGMRCNSTVRLNIQVTNTGSIPFNGKLALVLDELTSLSNALTPTLEEIGDSLLWSIEDLFLGESEMIKITINTPSEQFTGELVQFNTYLFDESDNELSLSEYETIVRCSYDPNDKATAPQRGGLSNYTLFEEDLRYTIRFENTGNDTAFLVRISDELDTDLDWSTFKFIQASHPLTSYTLTKEGLVIFTFDNINLLATMQDSSQSMGYVQYGISPKPGLAENTPIENKAAIFFDANPPIVTNTVINTMVSELPTFVKHLKNKLGVQLFPNPFNQELFLETQQSYSDLQVRVFNLRGQLIFEKGLSIYRQEEKIDLPFIGEGLFIFQLVDMESGQRSSFRMFRGQ